jgi:hypothetical protein
MSRSGYTDDGCNGWDLVRWRGAVASAIRGARGQALLREMATALDSMPEKRLIANELERDGTVCALGCVGLARGIDMSATDPEDYEQVAELFGISQALAREIECVNDEAYMWRIDRRGFTKRTAQEAEEERWKVVRAWVAENIRVRRG